MKKLFICIILGSIVMMLIMTSVYAGFNGIIVTNDQSAEPVYIETDQPTIDIPIVVRGIRDVYGFDLSMSYSPEIIRVESISLGDIFKGFGSAVVKNDINNTTGQVRFMQTILVADHGAAGDSTLCTVRLTLKPGEYEIIRDIGVKIKIANSAAKYIDAYVIEGKIAVNGKESGGDIQPTPEISPAATATIGIVTPAPDSSDSDNFEVAENETVDDIIKAVTSLEEEKATKSPPFIKDTEDMVTTNQKSDTVANLQDTGGFPIIFVFVITVLVLAIGLLVVFYILHKRRIKNYSFKQKR